MKIIVAISALGMLLAAAFVSAGAGVGDQAAELNHTVQEEAEGKALWDKFQSKQTACADFSADDFAALGEYFMGQMLGTSHEAMNNMMIQMMGQGGEEEMHRVMAKRLSGCDAQAEFPAMGRGFMPMMIGDWSSPGGFNQTKNFMMWNFGSGPMGWGGFGFGWIFGVLVWVLLMLAIAALIIWIRKQSK